jgi:hypothetical protein
MFGYAAGNWPVSQWTCWCSMRCVLPMGASGSLPVGSRAGHALMSRRSLRGRCKDGDEIAIEISLGGLGWMGWIMCWPPFPT